MIKLAKKFRRGKKKIRKDEIVNIKHQSYWKKPENVKENEIILERKEGRVKVLKERVPYERTQTYWIKKREQKGKGVNKEKEQQLSLNASIPVMKNNALSKVLNNSQIAKAKEKYGEEAVNTLLRIMTKRDQYEKGSFLWWKWQRIGEKYIQQLKTSETKRKRRDRIYEQDKLGKKHKILDIYASKDKETGKKTFHIHQIIRRKNLQKELKRHTVISENSKIIHNGIRDANHDKVELENPEIEEQKIRKGKKKTN